MTPSISRKAQLVRVPASLLPDDMLVLLEKLEERSNSTGMSEFAYDLLKRSCLQYGLDLARAAGTKTQQGDLVVLYGNEPQFDRENATFHAAEGEHIFHHGMVGKHNEVHSLVWFEGTAYPPSRQLALFPGLPVDHWSDIKDDWWTGCVRVDLPALLPNAVEGDSVELIGSFVDPASGKTWVVHNEAGMSFSLKEFADGDVWFDDKHLARVEIRDGENALIV